MFFMSVHNNNCFIMFKLLIYRIKDITDCRKYLRKILIQCQDIGNIQWKHCRLET